MPTMSHELPLFAEYDAAAGRRELPAPVEVRPARPGDVAACARLAVARNGGDVTAWEARLAADLDLGTVLVTVAVVGEAVGMGRAGCISWSDPAPAYGVPDGYYLTDLLVDPAWRRYGLAEQITRSRLAWVWERDTTAWYLVNAHNRVSLELHQKLGFREIIDDVQVPGVDFVGGRGVLCRADRPSSQGGPTARRGAAT
jgi:ribosomal protein S18 acetylase RimI-like enzyme